MQNTRPKTQPPSRRHVMAINSRNIAKQQLEQEMKDKVQMNKLPSMKLSRKLDNEKQQPTDNTQQASFLQFQYPYSNAMNSLSQKKQHHKRAETLADAIIKQCTFSGQSQNPNQNAHLAYNLNTQSCVQIASKAYSNMQKHIREEKCKQYDLHKYQVHTELTREERGLFQQRQLLQQSMKWFKVKHTQIEQKYDMEYQRINNKKIGVNLDFQIEYGALVPDWCIRLGK